MSFGYPLWLWALLLLPLLAFFFARAEQRGALRLQQFVAARLLPQLAGTVNFGRRIFRFGLLLLVLGLVIVSLARPRVGYSFDQVRRKGLDLILAVDVSRSMLSNDVAPSRLARVKLATQDLINELQGDRVGLIAFAGSAFLQAPLTIDYGAAIDSINDLDTKSIPEGGTNISKAIDLATRTYGKSATGNRALIIFTDGEELDGDADGAAKAAAKAGVRIFTVGVGTPAGSLIPIHGEDGGTAFVKDEQGQVVKSKLNEESLRAIAKATGGFYLHLENGPRTMQQLFSEGLGKMQVADINGRLARRPIERYEWPLAAAILLFAIALLINDRQRKRTRTREIGAVPSPLKKRGRRASAAVVPILLLILVRQSYAASAGLDLYEQQKFPEAYEHFQQTLKENPGTRQSDRLDFDSGAAAYKMKDYNKALQSFSQALLSKSPQLEAASHYNLGNTLYQRGEAEKDETKKLTDWEGALQHYQETLKAEPKNKEAQDNYDYVKKKIEELKNKQKQSPSPTPTPPPQKNQDKNDKNNQQQQNKDQQNKDQQKNDQQQKGQNGQGSGQGQPQPNQSPSATPTPTPTPTPSPGSSPSPGENSPTPTPTPTPSPGDQAGNSPTPSPTPGDQAGSSPSPSPGEGESPTPTPGSEGSPTPTPGEGGQNGNNGQQPAPSGTPAKPLTGEVKGAGDQQPKESPTPAEAAEAEAEKEGQMTPKQAARLLQSMKDEEQKVLLDEHKAVRRVYKDW